MMSRWNNPWVLVDAMRAPWHALDAAVTKYSPEVHHRVLDSLVGRLKGKSVFWPFGFFPDGWGEVGIAVKFFEDFMHMLDTRQQGKIPCSAALQVSLSKPVSMFSSGVTKQVGQFPTPFQAPGLLPPESMTGWFEWVKPDGWDAQDPATRATVVVLAGTGEQGFRRRHHYMSLPLAAQGISTLVLESPFYGLRRPPGQKASKLRRVSDLPVLGRATLEEALGLLQWLRLSGEQGPLVVAGNSMGGLHAAMTAALCPFPVGVASWLGPTSAAPVFTEGVLASACEWRALNKDANDEKLEAALCELEARISQHIPAAQRLRQSQCTSAYDGGKRQMHRFLQLTNLVNFPVPVEPSAVTFVVALQDMYIPWTTAADHWDEVERRWAGCTIHRIRAGHVSGILFPPLEFSSMVIDVVRKLSASAAAASPLHRRSSTTTTTNICDAASPPTSGL